MSLFASAQSRHENKAKTPRVSATNSIYRPWLQPMLWSLVVLVVILSMWRLNQALAVSQWEIQAEQGLKQQIDDFLSQQEHMDFWSSRASVLQTQLFAAIPDIQDVEVRRVLPDGLFVQAVGRVPLALWTDSQGQAVMLLDYKANAYRALKAGEAVDLPVMRLPKADLQHALKLLRLLQVDEKRMSALSEVIVEGQRWRLNFGHGEQWQLHVSNLEQDLQRIMHILEQSRWNSAYWRMDARIPQRWFIRPAMQGVI
ncbi:MAG: hypothetical protein Q9M19_05535 [Mariprofundaceae bacterium]|nr:hypothetical protein [Mariprofundaceae bacterium]